MNRYHLGVKTVPTFSQAMKIVKKMWLKSMMKETKLMLQKTKLAGLMHIWPIMWLSILCIFLFSSIYYVFCVKRKPTSIMTINERFSIYFDNFNIVLCAIHCQINQILFYFILIFLILFPPP